MEKKPEVKILKQNSDLFDVLLLCLCVLSVFFIIWTFTGNWPWKGNPYNSYFLQAQSWLHGRLDVDERSWLELAIFKGKYFISFPPFPSYIMLPFAAIGWETCDGFLALASALTGAIYAYKLAKSFNKSGYNAIFWSLFAVIGTNILFVSVVPWVWFIAQNMCFALTVMALYYARTGKGGISFAAWACAVGCRPFSVFSVFPILFLLYDNVKDKYQDKNVIEIIIAHWKWYIAPVAIALSYMILNAARFGNPLEFGHNYLPEFTDAEHGQFWLGYIAENAKNLFKLPPVNSDGIFEYPAFNGFCLFYVSPLFVTYVIYSLCALVKQNEVSKIAMLIIALAVISELLCLTAHKTMGGSQFGNRYTNDVLPLVLLGIMLCPVNDKKNDFWNSPLLLFGFALNLVGTVMYYARY